MHYTVYLWDFFLFSCMPFFGKHQWPSKWEHRDHHHWQIIWVFYVPLHMSGENFPAMTTLTKLYFGKQRQSGFLSSMQILEHLGFYFCCKQDLKWNFCALKEASTSEVSALAGEKQRIHTREPRFHPNIARKHGKLQWTLTSHASCTSWFIR